MLLNSAATSGLPSMSQDTTTDLPKQKKSPKGKLHRCSFHCEFQARNSVTLKSHEILHKKKSLFQCQICSYSVHQARYLKLHWSRDHLIGLISHQVTEDDGNDELSLVIHEVIEDDIFENMVNY